MVASKEHSKIVLVTGCSTGGIGFALCQEFAERGCIVYATALKLEDIGGIKHGNIYPRVLDVTNPNDVQTVVENVVEIEGRIDILVNNAGMLCVGPTVDVSMDQVQRTFDTSVYGVLRMARAVFPHMVKRRSGLIINIGSIAGELPAPWNGIYSASKAAVNNLSDTLAIECKPFSVKVMLVTPGGVQSNISRNNSKIFELQMDSLYRAYLPCMIKRMHASQDRSSISTAEFARCLVDKALSDSPPLCLRLGGHTTLYLVLKWLPRWLQFWILWKIFTRR